MRRDADGFLYFIGRRDEMIKTSGYRVSPTEVEEVVLSTGLVVEVAAVGVPHATLGQAIAIVVAAAPNVEASSDKLIEACRSQLPLFMVPHHVGVARVAAAQSQRQVRPSEARGRAEGAVRTGGTMSLGDLGPHAPHPFFGVADDCLTVAGRSLVDIAGQAGRTPFYAYSRVYLSERVAALRATLPAQVHLHYAIKANPMPAVVRHMAPLVDGLDVASAREMRVALDAGMRPDLISFAGPGKTPAELEAAVAAGIVLNVESELEIERLAEIARRTGARPQVAVRVNPDFELKTSGMKMSGGPKQFGIDAERVPAVLEQIGRLPLDVRRFPHLQRLAEPARRGDRRSAAEGGRARDRAGACGARARARSSTSAAASASRISPARSRSTWRRSRPTCGKSSALRAQRYRRRSS